MFIIWCLNKDFNNYTEQNAQVYETLMDQISHFNIKWSHPIGAKLSSNCPFQLKLS